MTAQFNRRDVGYTIISRFEEALREFLRESLKILFEDYKEGIPIGIISKTQGRASISQLEDISDFLENTDFPDLKEIVCYNSSYKMYFPFSVLSVQEFSSLYNELYVLRCKIAHIRGTFNSLDLDKLSETSRKLAEQLEDFGRGFIDFVQALLENPETAILPVPKWFESETILNISIPNNIPIADYEYEGGFVGRSEDIKKVTKLLEGEQVVTVAGAGGVGKTALISKVIEQILRQGNNRFDGIVWLSAKETKLSYLGIEDVEPTVKNYEQLLDTILEVMGFPASNNSSLKKKENEVKIVSELYKSILIIIDNLETITDESIVDFLLDIKVNHPNVKILITSRKGLGQVERRHELKELKEKEAIQLFRLIAKDKNLDRLVNLDEHTIKELVKKLSFFPLAIKWMLGQVAIGKDVYTVIDSINETTSDISKFSFEQIYKSLSDPARKILCALSFFDEPPVAGVLGYVVNIERDELEDGIKELILVSLVISEQFKDEQEKLSNRYVILPLTRGYIRQQLDKDTFFKQSVEERLRKVQATVEEAEKAEKIYRFTLSNMGAVTEEEKVSAMMAQNAFQKYQTGRYTEAYEEYKRACEIAPRFASIYRNWAVMESDEGHSVEADKLMEKASKLSPEDPQIWLTWGTIKMKNERVKEALEKYEKAYQLDPENQIVLNYMGRAKCRSGEHEESDKLLRSAMKQEPVGSQVKSEIINLSSLAENLSRWGEQLSECSDHIRAEEKLKEALQYCEKLITLDSEDPKSERLLRRTHRRLGFFYKKRRRYHEAVAQFEQAIFKELRGYTEIKYSVASVIEACKLLQNLGETDKALELCTPELQKASERLGHRDMENQEKLRKIIRDLKGRDRSPKRRIKNVNPS